MAATVRRVARMLLVVVMLGALGATVGIADLATAGAAPSDSSATPPVPTSTIKSAHGSTVTYCVSGYAPNSTVNVVDQANGNTGTIPTDANGAGCTTIQVKTACDTSVEQTITATGTDQTGNPATSQVDYNAPPDSSQCTPTPSPSPTRTPKPHPTPHPTHPPKCKPSQAHLSVQVVPEGALVRGTACGFTPGETVFVYLHSATVFVGSTTAGPKGNASMQVRIPKCLKPGEHTIEFVGQASGHVAKGNFRVTRSSACRAKTGAHGGSVVPVSGTSGDSTGGASGSTSGSTSGGGTLAFTGADILAMVLVALGLVGFGVATLSVRRRRTA